MIGHYNFLVNLIFNSAFRWAKENWSFTVSGHQSTYVDISTEFLKVLKNTLHLSKAKLNFSKLWLSTICDILQ